MPLHSYTVELISTLLIPIKASLDHRFVLYFFPFFAFLAIHKTPITFIHQAVVENYLCYRQLQFDIQRN